MDLSCSLEQSQVCTCTMWLGIYFAFKTKGTFSITQCNGHNNVAQLILFGFKDLKRSMFWHVYIISTRSCKILLSIILYQPIRSFTTTTPFVKEKNNNNNIVYYDIVDQEWEMASSMSSHEREILSSLCYKLGCKPISVYIQ